MKKLSILIISVILFIAVITAYIIGVLGKSFPFGGLDYDSAKKKTVEYYFSNKGDFNKNVLEVIEKSSAEGLVVGDVDEIFYSFNGDKGYFMITYNCASAGLPGTEYAWGLYFISDANAWFENTNYITTTNYTEYYSLSKPYYYIEPIEERWFFWFMDSDNGGKAPSWFIPKN